MAKKNAPAPGVERATLPDGPVEVRALRDHPELGLQAGRLGLVPPEAVQALRDAHVVDDHPDAVAYAKAQAAPDQA